MNGYLEEKDRNRSLSTASSEIFGKGGGERSNSKSKMVYGMDDALDFDLGELSLHSEAESADDAKPKDEVVTFEEITAAAYRIHSSLVDTPCTKSRMSEQLGMTVWLKKEFMQYTGSYKERGVRYALLMLDEETKKRGVVAASGGSYAYALAYHGDQLGIPIVLFVPTFAPLMQIQWCAQNNAKVYVKGNTLLSTTRIAKIYAKQNNIRFLNTRCDRFVAAGNATLGLDIIKEVPNIDAVIVPVSDGTLAAGTALAVKSHNPQIQVIACRHTAATAGGGFDTDASGLQPKPLLTSDNILVTASGVRASSLIDKEVATTEEENAAAIICLIEMEKCLVEEEGACGLAAALSGRLPELRGKRVVVLLTGGNTDTTKVDRMIERGLVASGRLHHFSLIISDQPGGLRELCNFIADLGVSIKEIFHERRFINDIKSVQVRCVVETRDAAHAEGLQTLLRNRYGQVDSEIDSTSYGVDLRQLYDFS